MSTFLERDLANYVFNPNFRRGHNWSYFAFGPWAIYPWYGQIGKNFYLLNMNFDDTILKGLFLIIQNRCNWIHRNQVMAVERVPDPLGSYYTLVPL